MISQILGNRTGVATIHGPSAFKTAQPEGIVPRPNPIKPLGGPFRRWHLTPWKRTEATALLDDLGGMGDDGEDDGSDTSAMDILNNLVTQAGNIYGAKSGLVPYRPKAGQLLPAGTTISPFTGMSSTTMLMLGAAVLGVVLLAKK
jgi:hypothetical protein